MPWLSLACLATLAAGLPQLRTWDILAPFAYDADDILVDPVAPPGIAALSPEDADQRTPTGFESPLPATAGWRRFESQGAGGGERFVHVDAGLARVPFAAWAIGRLRVKRRECVRLDLQHAAEAWLESPRKGRPRRLVTRGFAAVLGGGTYRLDVLVRSPGGTRPLVWSISSCEATAPGIEWLPPAVDSWEMGHDLPDVLQGRLVGELLAVTIRNVGAEWARNVSLRVAGSQHVTAAVSGVARDLAPLQVGRLDAPLLLREAAKPQCPLLVSVEVLVGDAVVVRQQVRCLCRERHDRLTFLYRDFDGTAQVATVKMPQRAESCVGSGCPVLFSLHGMDVTAQRQTDCYRAREDMWILSPLGRGTHGFNWQGPGHWSALAALAALTALGVAWGLPADLSQIIFTGHSNGAYGAWLLASLNPDVSKACAPLSGMAQIGTTEFRLQATGVSASLRELWQRTCEEYRGFSYAVNLVPAPFLARAGAEDRVIAPSATMKMGDALRRAGHKTAKIVILPGKEHWWWDTTKPMDGGVMDDDEMRDFFTSALNATAQQEQAERRMVCVNPVSCGALRGVRVSSQHVPLKASVLTVAGPCLDSSTPAAPFAIRTENVRRLSIHARGEKPAWQLSVDGQQLEVRRRAGDAESVAPATRPFVLCQESAQSRWIDCARAAGACCADKRYAEAGNLGPMRRIWASPLEIVYGTTAADAIVRQAYVDTAVQLSVAWSNVARGDARIVSDTEWMQRQRGGTTGQSAALTAGSKSTVLVGDPTTNAATAANSFWTRFFGSQALRMPVDGAEGKEHLEACGGNASGIVALGPAANVGDAGAMELLVAGVDLEGFHRARRIFESRTFDVNSWQQRGPDYVLVGSNGRGNLASVRAAGFWNHDWNFSVGLAYCRRPKAKGQTRPKKSGGTLEEL